MTRKASAGLAALVAVTAWAGGASAGEAKKADAPKWKLMYFSTAQFTSKAPLEQITGTTTKIEADLAFDAAKPETAAATVGVDVASLRTGIDMRDEHVRGPQWLDAAKYPKISFVLDSVKLDGPLADGKPVKGKAKGRITIKGVTKEIAADVVATYVKLNDKVKSDQFGFTNDLFKAEIAFPVKFTDFGMQVPQILFYKLADTLQAEATLTFVKADPAPTAAK